LGNWEARADQHDRWRADRGEPSKSPVERAAWIAEHRTREEVREPLQPPTLTEAQIAEVLRDTQAELADPEQLRRGAAQLAHQCTWYARQAEHYRDALDRVTEALPAIVARAIGAAARRG
jgi:hypothetical protein